MYNFLEKKNGLNWHEKFIVSLAEVIKPKVYCELGVYKCKVINKIQKIALKNYAVDIDVKSKSYLKKKRATFFNMTTDDFFKYYIENKKTEYIDMLFIDADHSYEQVKKDVTNFFPLISDDGYILIHDTFPLNEFHTSSGYSGDGFRFIQDLKSKNQMLSNYEILTISVPPGLTIIKKSTGKLRF
jgi:predicted O-methyltransferase YrrM